MNSNYEILAQYVQDNVNSLQNAAKVINAWIWSSLLPGGYGPVPTDAQSAAEVLNGSSCGWRHILLVDLFESVGVQTRTVNFYNMPFQGNHTTTELFIDGKWMWFDPTFGTYFEPKGGGQPLSMEEARSQWPDIDVKKSILPGWQGTFVDLDTIHAGFSYNLYEDSFFYQSKEFFGEENIAISGEINSLYFGPQAAYWFGGPTTPIPGSTSSWLAVEDTADAYAWMRYVNTYDSLGRLDFRWFEYDLDSARTYAHFVDYDQDNRYDWAIKTTFVGKLRNGVMDYCEIKYDNGTKRLIEYDSYPNSYNWKEKITSFTASGLLDRQEGTYDNGQSWVVEYDDLSRYNWSSYRDAYDAAGQIQQTVFQNDDGSQRTINWSLSKIVGTDSSETLRGTAGDDWLIGGDGDDVLIGGAGRDRLEGGLGNDVYYTDDLAEFVIELPGEGIDTVRSNGNHVLGANIENLVMLSGIYGTGNELDNRINGNAENNVLSGESGNDYLLGLAGNDLIVGGEGDDLIEGGAGADTLSGNYGADTFIFRNISDLSIRTSTTDLIRDFSYAGGDRISLNFIDANEGVAGDQAFKFIGTQGFNGPGEVRYVQFGGETCVLLNTDSDADYEGIIRLSGLVNPEASWFIL